MPLRLSGCKPDCDGRECGNDGCGGHCGTPNGRCGDATEVCVRNQCGKRRWCDGYLPGLCFVFSESASETGVTFQVVVVAVSIVCAMQSPLVRGRLRGRRQFPSPATVRPRPRLLVGGLTRELYCRACAVCAVCAAVCAVCRVCAVCQCAVCQCAVGCADLITMSSGCER